jgi:hypothetical protein
MIAFPINTIVHALGTMSGAMNALGWSAVIAIIYLLLSVGYTYFYFTTTKEQVV